MSLFTAEAPEALSPLEAFVRDYVETTGGDWEEVEPQVYDVLLPAGPGEDREIVRVAFDPEALPEHPGAQLASFGTPLLDRLLAGAQERGRLARFYLVGLNLTPHDLERRVRRAITLTPGLELRVEKVRPLYFAQAVYWFRAIFVSDQKEEDVVPVALDLHYGRQVRHMEALLDPARLAEEPTLPLAEARRESVAAAYPAARERALRTVAALANTRARELNERLERQVARMRQYYADLREELEEQARRTAARGDDTAAFASRREALEREERLRIAELRQKNSLRIELRLLQLAVIQQPKLLVRTAVASERTAAPLELVWDPLMEALEAAPCPVCGKPTFAFGLDRHGRLECQTCLAAPTNQRHARH
jgi:hypothetical protein